LARRAAKALMILFPNLPSQVPYAKNVKNLESKITL